MMETPWYFMHQGKCEGPKPDSEAIGFRTLDTTAEISHRETRGEAALMDVPRAH